MTNRERAMDSLNKRKVEYANIVSMIPKQYNAIQGLNMNISTTSDPEKKKRLMKSAKNAQSAYNTMLKRETVLKAEIQQLTIKLQASGISKR